LRYALENQGFFVFLGKKHHSFTIAPFCRFFGLEDATLQKHIERTTFY
jgi:hypothetical protein